MKCEANPAGKNSSFIFTVCVKSVPFYHFKLAFVVTDTVQYGFQKIFQNPLLKWRNRLFLIDFNL